MLCICNHKHLRVFLYEEDYSYKKWSPFRHAWANFIISFGIQDAISTHLATLISACLIGYNRLINTAGAVARITKKTLSCPVSLSLREV